MKHHISSFLCYWVSFVERHAAYTLTLLFLLTVLFSSFAYQNFSINSDLGDLINPSKENLWYKTSEEYKEAFPQYRHTALVVVSGASAASTSDTAEQLSLALRNSGHFEEVFAPAFDDFFQERMLYSIPSEGVKRIAEKVLDNSEALKTLLKTPDIKHFLQRLETPIKEGQSFEYLTEDSRKQMAIIVKAIRQLELQQDASLAMVEKFKPRDEKNIHYQIIVVKSAMNFAQELPNAVTINNIRSVLSQQQTPAGIDVRISGEVALANEEIAAGMSGVELAGSLSLLLLALILGIGIRSLSVISAIFMMLMMGIAWTAAYATAMVGSYNTLSLIFLVMFFGLGVDFAVHYCLRLIEAKRLEVSSTSTNTDSAAVIATADLGTTLLLCAITSSIAFLAFLPTEYNGLAELGLISAGGMAIAFLLSLTFFPAWFAIAGYGKIIQKQVNKNQHDKKKSFTLPTTATLIATLLLASVAAYFAKDISFSYSVLAMRDQDTEAMSTLLDMQRSNIVTDYSIFVVADPNSDIAQLKEQLLQLTSVAKVELPQDHLPQFQQIKQQYMLPVHEQLSPLDPVTAAPAFDPRTSQDAITAMIELLDVEQQDAFIDEDEEAIKALSQALETLSANSDLQKAFQKAIVIGVNQDLQRLQQWFAAKPYDLMDLPANVRDRLYSEELGLLLNVIPKADMTNKQETDQFVFDVMGVAPNVAGRTIMEWGIGKVVVESFVQAVITAVVGITILLALYFRHWVPVVLVLIPLFLTTLFTFAFIQITGMTLNMANILVVPLIFGLGVDTGIHVVHRYHQSYDLNEMLFSSTSKAVLISALTTIGTFISLSFSAHKGAASIGLLLSVAISLLLITTFIVLPALLAAFDKRTK